VEYCNLQKCGTAEASLSELAALDAFAALCLRDLSTAYFNDFHSLLQPSFEREDDDKDENW
jgi:hypothetical protein